MTLNRRHRPFRSTGQWETRPPLKHKRRKTKTSSASTRSSSLTKTCFRATWAWKDFPPVRPHRGRAENFACPRPTAWTAGTTPRWRTTAACRRRPRTRRYSCEENGEDQLSSMKGCEMETQLAATCAMKRVFVLERKLFVLWDYLFFCKLLTVVFVSVRKPVATRDILMREFIST